MGPGEGQWELVKSGHFKQRPHQSFSLLDCLFVDKTFVQKVETLLKVSSFNIEGKQFFCGNWRKLQLIINVKGTDSPWPGLASLMADTSQFTSARVEYSSLYYKWSQYPRQTLCKQMKNWSFMGHTAVWWQLAAYSLSDWGSFSDLLASCVQKYERGITETSS